MILNALLRCSPAAGRAAAASRLLQHQTRFRVNPARNCDGLLRHRCFASAPEDTKTRLDTKQQQSDLVNRRILQARFQLNSCKIPNENAATSTDGQRRRKMEPVAEAKAPDKCKVPPSKAEHVPAAKVCKTSKPLCNPEEIPPSCPPKSDETSASGTDGSAGDSSKRNLYLLIAAVGALLGGYLMFGRSSSSSDSKSDKKAGQAAAGGAQANTNQKSRVPASAADIPKHVPYLLIGGGTASFAAFRAIKSADPKAKVLVVTDETEMPYMRPPLSKEMWLGAPDAAPPAAEQLNFKQWNGKERSLFFEPADFYLDPARLMEAANGGVAIVRGYTVRHIDVCTRTAVLTDGTEIRYDECLLATGSQPRNLDVFTAAPQAVRDRVSVFKTVADFERLRQSLGDVQTVAVIGGGFLGSELSCALAKWGRERKGLQVYQVFREAGNMGRVLPRYLSEWTANRVREEGVQVVTDTQVEKVSMQDGRVRMRLVSGQDLLVDRVVVAVGSEPDTKLAERSGLEVDATLGGYVVNAELEARRHLYVAGDAACFYDTKLGRRRVEHHDHAVVSGRLAGENMVGQKKPYKHQSMFWSDIGPKVGFEAIGIVDARLPTVGVFARASASDTPAGAAVDNLDADLKKTTNAADSTAELLAAQQQLLAQRPARSAAEEELAAAARAAIATAEAERYGKGVLFYLRDEKVVGVVLWNVFNRINTARAIVNEHKKWDDLNELAKLFEIHS